MVRGTVGLDWRDFEKSYKFDRNKKRGEKMREKKREPATRKPADSQPKVGTKGQLDSKIRELKSQESLLLFLFVENCPEILTEPMIELVWNFMEFLKCHGYYIINKKEVFCFPASKLVRLAGLK